MKTLTQFVAITIVLTVGLSAVFGAAYRVNVAANWDEQRCDSYVVPIAGFFKPASDPRTAAQFATDNWTFCQKEYIQNALREAAEVPKALAASSAGSVGVVQDIASTVADVFYDLWNFCYETYSSFMDQMKVMGKLFHNFMINIYSVVQRLNASILSIIYGLIGLIITVINSIHVTIMVVLIILGIITGMMIILFFALIPIMPLYITVTALVITVVATMASLMATEGFDPGACFAEGTPVQLMGDTTCVIEKVKIGDVLRDGGRVTAVHTFRSNDTLYTIHGVYVTGDHLIAHPDFPRRMIPVSQHPDAVPHTASLFQGTPTLWCLTTTSRRIPCTGAEGVLLFADWEEIPASNTDDLRDWYRAVWRRLNTMEPCPRVIPQRILDAEAGLSPDCTVKCAGWTGLYSSKFVKDIQIGDRIMDSHHSTTPVIGIVRLSGDQVTDAVAIERGQLVSCATWTLQGRVWKPASGEIREIHPATWIHLYTKSGKILVGDTVVRDASDVGLEHLRPLVDSIVLGSCYDTK